MWSAGEQKAGQLPHGARDSGTHIKTSPARIVCQVDPDGAADAT